MNPRALHGACAAALLWLFAGCNDDKDSKGGSSQGDGGGDAIWAPCCFPDGTCPISVWVSRPPTVTSAPLIVRGTCQADDARAILGLVAATHHATSDSFNFQTWSVSFAQDDLHGLPTLEGGADGGAERMVGIPIQVVDVAGRTCMVSPDKFPLELALEEDEEPADMQSDAATPGVDADAGTPDASAPPDAAVDGG